MAFLFSCVGRDTYGWRRCCPPFFFVASTISDHTQAAQMIRLFGVFGPFTAVLLLAMFIIPAKRSTIFVARPIISNLLNLFAFYRSIFFLNCFCPFSKFLVEPWSMFLISSRIYLSP